jgi:hypothetical protein
MPPLRLNDVKFWRGQAAELRAIAVTYKDKPAAEALYRLANNYDAMAEHSEDRTKGGIADTARDPKRKESTLSWR